MSAVPDKEQPARPHLEPLDGGADPASSALLDYTSAGTSLVAAYRTHGHLAAKLFDANSEVTADPWSAVRTVWGG